MEIPPASFRVTPYGEVDAKAFDSLRVHYDTPQLLRLVDRLDGCLTEIGGIGSIRDKLLRLHAMAMTIFESAPLSVPVTAVDAIWEEAGLLQENLATLISCFSTTIEQLNPLLELAPDLQG